MKQILIINSLTDQRFLTFLEKVFFSIGVGTFWEDYESIRKKTNQDDFQETVEASSAIFLVLSQDAQVVVKDGDLDFLKSDFARNKEIFVFEHCDDLKRITIQVPRLSQYFSMYITNAWNDEVVKSASVFEAAARLPLSFPEVKLEPLSSPVLDTFFSESTGRALFDLSTSRPAGKKAVCPHCAASYVIHTPADMRVLRCAVCGQFSEIKVLVTAGAAPDEQSG